MTLFTNVQTTGRGGVTFEYFSKWGYPYRLTSCLPTGHIGDIYTVVGVFPLSLLDFGVILLPEKRSHLEQTEGKCLGEH